MPDTIAFGICGLGFMGRTYFRHLRIHPAARVAAVFDRDERRRSGDWGAQTGNLNPAAGGLTDMSGIRRCATIDELLDDNELCAVAVTLPTPLHAEVAIAALRAGKHVICEKPMSLSLPDCDAMIAAAEASGRTLMIAQCIRFWPQYELIAARVAAGSIGRVRYAVLRRTGPPPVYSSGNWLMDHRQSGGALFDLHVHDVDFAHILLGTPGRVHALGCIGPSGGIDHVAAAWRYQDGRYAVVEGGWTLTPPAPFDMSIVVCGEAGTLEWSLLRGPEVLCYSGGGVPERIAVDDATGWTRELDYFIACVQSHRPVLRCTPQSSRLSIGLALAEKQSIESGDEVVVSPLVAGCA